MCQFLSVTILPLELPEDIINKTMDILRYILIYSGTFEILKNRKLESEDTVQKRSEISDQRVWNIVGWWRFQWCPVHWKYRCRSKCADGLTSLDWTHNCQKKWSRKLEEKGTNYKTRVKNLIALKINGHMGVKQ